MRSRSAWGGCCEDRAHRPCQIPAAAGAALDCGVAAIAGQSVASIDLEAILLESHALRTPFTRDFLRHIEAAIKWLQFLSSAQDAGVGPSDNAAIALQVTARALTQDTSAAAATSVATELATRLSCERVSIGFKEGRDLKLYALSHSARYESRQNLIKRIEAAIEEAADQKETLVYPATESSTVMLQAHDDLARIHGGSYICTVPLIRDDEVIGGVIFERGASAGSFAAETV